MIEQEKLFTLLWGSWCYYITSYSYAFQDASCCSSGIHKLPNAATAVRPYLHPTLFFFDLAGRVKRSRKSVTVNFTNGGGMIKEGKFHTIFHEKIKSWFSVLFPFTRSSRCFATSRLSPECIAGLQCLSLGGQRAAGSDGSSGQQPVGCPACRDSAHCLLCPNRQEEPHRHQAGQSPWWAKSSG